MNVFSFKIVDLPNDCLFVFVFLHILSMTQLEIFRIQCCLKRKLTNAAWQRRTHLHMWIHPFAQLGSITWTMPSSWPSAYSRARVHRAAYESGQQHPNPPQQLGRGVHKGIGAESRIWGWARAHFFYSISAHGSALLRAIFYCEYWIWFGKAQQHLNGSSDIVAVVG